MISCYKISLVVGEMLIYDSSSNIYYMKVTKEMPFCYKIKKIYSVLKICLFRFKQNKK